MDPSPTPATRETKRYITALNEAGKSIFTVSPDLHYHFQGGISYSRLYGTNATPPNRHANADIKQYLSQDGDVNITSFSNTAIAIPGGINFIQAEIAPSAIFPWHRTLSVDFVTVIDGVIEIEVEEAGDMAKKILLKPGDSVIQRATVHRWINPSSTSSARFVVTTVSTELPSHPNSVDDAAGKYDPFLIP
ncbi:hypothetical protein BGW36DRAFT_433353 [Talaromyces proteolyticus]|uniref:Cupin type-2 domain-containing protein n=1 Tax=Talaromyces proteolyticus TaxID=1131652 RepID=A0AAD4KDP3_9EURO|nr:uncharacterized protein BGW36DRAFT_433353 [Talaromyces proteolyticus]KAH8689347.1 hypothetical protein BGW36DRAFT_433353 [Talaromyces proteolyticus]